MKVSGQKSARRFGTEMSHRRLIKTVLVFQLVQVAGHWTVKKRVIRENLHILQL